MSVGIFTDKKHQPTEAEILKALGATLPLWEALIGYIREAYPVQEDLKFLYGKNYGWGRRFRVKGQHLTSLFPASGHFAVQVNLSSEAIQKVQNMNLGENAQIAIASAHPYPEGRWLFIPVQSESDLKDVQMLLAMRADEKRIRQKQSSG